VGLNDMAKQSTAGLVATMGISAASPIIARSNHGVISRSTARLAPVVKGVPLRDLAEHALSAAEGYGVRNPHDVRVVVSSQAALWNLVPLSGGANATEYIIKLQGRFSCPNCDTSNASPPGRTTTTTTLTKTATSTMILEVAMPIGNGTNAVYEGVGDPDLSKLGRVYDLDPYVASLAHVRVRPGPLPG